VIERAVILARGQALRIDLALAPIRSARSPDRTAVRAPEHGSVVTDREFRERERENLVAALEETGWRISGTTGAAALLGVKPTTLASRMKALGVERPGRRGASRH